MKGGNPALAFKAPQAPNPDEMETQQLVDDLEKLMNDDLMCDDATPEVAVEPKVDGYGRQAAKDANGNLKGYAFYWLFPHLPGEGC